MEIQFSQVADLLLPAVTGAVGWLAGRRKQKNDFLAELQSSVNLLSEKNKEFVEEVVRLREENLMIRGEVIKLREENRTLRLEIETLNKNLVSVGRIGKQTPKVYNTNIPVQAKRSSGRKSISLHYNPEAG